MYLERGMMLPGQKPPFHCLMAVTGGQGGGEGKGGGAERAWGEGKGGRGGNGGGQGGREGKGRTREKVGKGRALPQRKHVLFEGI